MDSSSDSDNAPLAKRQPRAQHRSTGRMPRRSSTRAAGDPGPDEERSTGDRYEHGRMLCMLCPQLPLHQLQPISHWK